MTRIIIIVIIHDMKLINATKTLEDFDRAGHTVWSLSDLRIVFSEKPATFRKTLERLCSEEVLVRVSRGVYLFARTGRDKHAVFGGGGNALRGPGVGQGIAAGHAAAAVGRNPGARGEVMSTMLLGQAVAETTGLYGLAVAMILLFANPLLP